MQADLICNRPYVNHMTASELHQTLTSGFATIAGSVLAAYIGFVRFLCRIACQDERRLTLLCYCDFSGHACCILGYVGCSECEPMPWVNYGLPTVL